MAIQSNFPSIRPSLLLDFANSKRLDPRVTFTRASTATYYDGVTVSKAEENLLTYSQDFSNAAWTKGQITVTADSVAAPDGTTTADTIAANSTVAEAYVRFTTAQLTSTAYTLSVFAKANVVNFARLRNLAVSGAPSAWFDLSSGTVGTVGAGLTATITSVGNSWYRCTITGTTLSSITNNLIDLAPAASDNSTAVTNLDSVYLWGAQLEQRSSVTAYTPTTTQAITNYVPRLLTAAANVARFDHTPTTGASLGLLVEESRQNLMTYSDDFANAAWTKSDMTISSNALIAPDGTQTADKFTPNSGVTLSNTICRQDFGKSATSITYTFSAYGKLGEYNRLELLARDVATGNNNARVIVTLGTANQTTLSAAGTFSNALFSAVDVGNGWYRYFLTFTSGTETGIRFQLIVRDSSATTGDGYKGIYVWGAQAEAGAFATSYIPTVAAAVTRSADAASMTGTNFSSWYNASEGTVYTDTLTNVPLANADSQSVWNINDGTTNNRVRVNRAASTGEANLLSTAAGASVVSLVVSPVMAVGATNRVAAVYKVNDYAMTNNAGTVGTDTVATVPVVTRIDIGASQAQNFQLNGWMRKLAYYPARLTNAQLQAITG